MKTAFAATLAASMLLSAAAFAQGIPTVPSPSDPFPENPIATDGSYLPRAVYERPTDFRSLGTGRSVAIDGATDPRR